MLECGREFFGLTKGVTVEANDTKVASWGRHVEESWEFGLGGILLSSCCEFKDWFNSLNTNLKEEAGPSKNRWAIPLFGRF